MALERKGLYVHVGEYYVINKDYPITIGTIKKGSVVQVLNVKQEIPIFPKLTIFCKDLDSGHQFTMFEDNFNECATPASHFENMTKDDMVMWDVDRWFINTTLPYWIAGVSVILILIDRFL